ncbi:hypothetical protein HYS94_04765 [Candidatus Daviesbacteria bacterium]|nr:hypothetical protein [Candidatus Daviesbacteria bacterium]
MANLNKLSQALITAYDKVTLKKSSETISVNPVVAELASWYEKFRTAMEYRDDEVILRSAIERILKRRVVLGGTGETVAAPLIRELIWARYFPDSTIGEETVIKVAQAIDLYLNLEKEITKVHKVNGGLVNEWIYHLLSSEIEDILKPSPEKELMSNYMFKIFQDKIAISVEDEETKNIQVFIAVRRAYANEDLALLRFALFKQYFGKLNPDNLEKIVAEFPQFLKTVSNHFNYPLKDKIYNYIKKQIVPFIILNDVLKKYKGQISNLFSDESQLNLEIVNACTARYKVVQEKVKRAIVRSVIFIFFTKALFALFVEGNLDRFFYGKVIWSAIVLNTLTPPILLVLIGFFIEKPTRENSYNIVKRLNAILFDEEANFAPSLNLTRKARKTDPILDSLFLMLWLTTFILSFGAIIFILTKLQVNPISQAVFIFFLAIVSFISYRIQKTANMYILKDTKESFGTLAFDFFFMPFIQVGRKLTSAVSQLNIFLFIFDYIIEAPFKGIVAFFEQWLLFLRSQREKLE